MIKKVLKSGSGDCAKLGQQVVIELEGKFRKSKCSSKTYLKKVTQRGLLGHSKLIRGIELALMTMKPGEKVQLKIRPEYGYGQYGNSELGIPPGANLTVNLKLVKIVKPIDVENMKILQSWQPPKEPKMVNIGNLKV